MKQLYFTRPLTSAFGSQANLQIINDRGEILSLSADDSCGALPDLSRTALLKMDSDMNDLGPEQSWIEPDEFLQALAEFLGYTVTKKE